MKLSGDFTVNADPAAAYKYLTDPNFIVEHMPDVQLVGIDDEQTFRVQAKVGVSHIRGTFNAKCQLVEAHEPTSAAFTVKGSGVSSKIALDVMFVLAPAGDGATTVGWTGEAKLAGRLASVGAGLIEPIVQKNTDMFVDAIRRGIEVAEHGEQVVAAGERVAEPAAAAPGGLELSDDVKRIGLAVAALVALVLIWRLIRR
jgi:carbon monoxide dehydrogenase subunit G